MARFRKKADIELGDGGIDDVRKVIASLSKEDRERILARGRTEYRDIPARLAGRSVAYDKGTPVGFSDIWGLYDDGRVRPSPSITVAVSDEHRGRGIAGRVTKDAIRKVLDRVGKLRNEQGCGTDKLKRFVWRLHAGNDSSARAAEKAGFKEQTFSRPHNFRQFVMSREDAEKKAEAHHPDFDHVIRQFKDRFGIDLSHVKLKYSKHPRYNNGKRSYDFEDDETGGSHGHVGDDSIVWLNPNLRPVMNRFDVQGSVKDFRRWMMAHELAHEIDSTMKKKWFVRKMLDQARSENFHTGYLDRVPEHKMDKETFAEYMAHLLQEKKADARPSKEDLWRMYDIMQADARLAKRVEGLGFGRNGDAYRRAAIKLRVMELAKVLQDGKKIRNNIAHKPGYIPSEQDANRALRQYEDAEAKLKSLS